MASADSVTLATAALWLLCALAPVANATEPPHRLHHYASVSLSDRDGLPQSGLTALASAPRPGASPDELVAAADQALYQAKAAGRNTTRPAATGRDQAAS